MAGVRPGLESRPGLGSGGSRGVEGPRPTRTVVVVDRCWWGVGSREASRRIYLQ